MVFISSQIFPFFQDYAVKAEIICSYYQLSLEDQNKKNIWFDGQETDNVDTGRGWQSWVTRWRELCTKLDVSDRKLAKLLLDK